AKGDELLKKTTKLLLESKFEKIVIARIGGDEFALILPDCSLEQLYNEENRIKDAVERYNSSNRGIPLSISTGSAFTSDRRKSIYTLFKEADNCMYREKLSHKGSVRNITIQALSNMMKARDFTTQDHIDRMGELTGIFGMKAGLSTEHLNILGLLVKFHDIGKVGIPDNILFKPSPLTDVEMEEMKKHSEIGYKIAFATPDIAPVAELILKHHERWDGTGYMLGLKGNDIPLECRIMSIVDAFDAMTNDRPYRKAMDIDFALKEIAQNAGTQFDPELAYLFIEMITKDRVLLKNEKGA
ncbi:MAG: HD-GYP domain-containing protein, partial [Ruminiclostridium sp.]|nr:HD-GYP domain-containing protein [Ruminiclostridium sp.]